MEIVRDNNRKCCKHGELKKMIPVFVESYIRKNYVSPTVDEVAYSLGASKSTIHQHLKNLHREGVLVYQGRIGVPKCMIKGI